MKTASSQAEITIKSELTSKRSKNQKVSLMNQLAAGSIVSKDESVFEMKDMTGNDDSMQKQQQQQQQSSSSQSQYQDHERVVLFVRVEGEPYACLGELGLVSCDMRIHPIRFVFRLNQYDELSSGPNRDNFYRLVKASTQ